MKISVIPNETRDKELVCTKKLVSLLKDRARVYMSDKYNVSGAERCTYEDLFRDKDMLIVLGGDGTILSVASDASRAKIPVLGINLGHVGFLAEVEPDMMEYAAERICSGNFSVQNRSMINGTIVNGDSVISAFDALNDIVITRSGYSRILTLKILQGGKELENFVGDGMIFSTPTGSTAYSLSAGGPVLSPEVDATLLTPVCAHTLHSKPIVLAASEAVTVKIIRPEDGTVNVYRDGEEAISITSEDEIIIKKSERVLKLVRLSDNTFYATLKEKLSEAVK